MTSLTSTNTRWRRAATGLVASGALVAGVLATTPTALAEPVSPVTPGGAASPTTPTEAGSDGAPAPMTADQMLAEISEIYDTGAGGGQVSELIHSVVKLRSQGFYPSKGNVLAIQDGLNRRPNLGPLRTALEQTLAFQRRAQQRGMMAQSQSPTQFGIGQIPPANGQPIQSPLDIPQA